MFNKNKNLIKGEESVLETVEFTLLDPRAISKDIHTLINVAIKNKYYGVCVNPVNVKIASDYIKNILNADLSLISVVGFPLGANTTKVKCLETKMAVKDGADEIDFVMNIAKIKDGDIIYLKKELSSIIKAAKGRIVKAIIETCYLTRDEIKQVCKVCEKANVDFIKTSTGYGTKGATVEDVSYIKECVRGRIGIKASGGIKIREEAEELIRAGATRIGSSKTL